MFYPQGNFNSQGIYGHPQGSFGYPQGSFGNPQGPFGQQSFQGTANGIPFANTLYGYPQPTSFFGQGQPMSNWQHPAQQQAQQQAALQQLAMLQLLAPQLAAQPFALQHQPGVNALSGLANGAAQSVGAWQQPQANLEQINPALTQQSQPHFLQRLAQYHYLVAQQLAQIAGQQTAQNTGNPYAGQFIPGQVAANFVPGSTMH